MREPKSVSVNYVELESIQVDESRPEEATVTFRVRVDQARKLAPLLFSKSDLVVTETAP